MGLVPRLTCTFMPSSEVRYKYREDVGICMPYWSFHSVTLDFHSPAPSLTSNLAVYPRDRWSHTPWAQLLALMLCLPHLSTVTLIFSDSAHRDQWETYIATLDAEPRKNILLLTVVRPRSAEQELVREAARMSPSEIVQRFSEEGRLCVVYRS